MDCTWLLFLDWTRNDGPIFQSYKKKMQETTHFFVEIRTQSHADFINYQTLPNLYARSFEENNQNYLLCPVLPQHSTQSKISPSSRQINYHKKEDNQRKKKKL